MLEFALLVPELIVFMLKLFFFDSADGFDALYHFLLSLFDIMGFFLHQLNLSFQPSSALDCFKFLFIVGSAALLSDFFLIMVLHLPEDNQFVFVLFSQHVQILPHLSLDVAISLLQLI